MSIRQKPIIHGRDHLPGHPDPIPGLEDLLGGTYNDAIRNADLTVWWQLGDTFTFAGSVNDAMVDVADFDTDSPRNLEYAETSSTNRPTLQVTEAVDEGDPGAVEFNFTGSSAGPRFFNDGTAGAGAAADVTKFGTTGDLAQTVSCWLKVKAGLGAVYGPAVGRWGMDGTGGNNVGWVIEVEQSTYVLRFRAKPSVGVEYLITGPTLTAGTWYHVAVTWDGTTWLLYVNGSFYDDAAGSSAPLDPSDRTEVAVGNSVYDLGAGQTERYFYGSVDSVAFWRRVLTPAEIAHIAAGSVPGAITEAVLSIAKSGDTALTGDVTLSAGSNVTLTQAGQDIAIAATGGGSGIPASIVDAKGDLIAASANDTVARFAVGSNDQVLVADSGQTLGIKWAAVPGTSAFVPVATIDAKGDLLVGTANDAIDNLTVGSNNQVLTADSGQTLGVKWATPATGAVVSDTIWDTKGDLAVATAADTAAVLAVGSNNQVLTADSAQSTGIKWATPSGGGVTEIAYVQFTSNVGVTATAEASGDTIVSAGAFTLTAVKHKIEFWASEAQLSSGSTALLSMIINLWDASTNVARIGYMEFPAANNQGGAPMSCIRYVTPTAASHTYLIKAWVAGTGAAGLFKAGSGTGGTNQMPGFIRITTGG